MLKSMLQLLSRSFWGIGSSVGLMVGTVVLHSPASVQAQATYSPLQLQPNREITDTLSEKDIPTGQGGFARDYMISLNKGDEVAIALTSDDFDAVVTLLAGNGISVAENDDGPDGSTNSLLFTQIPQSGTYIVRVRSFGTEAGGNFTLKLRRLQTIED